MTTYNFIKTPVSLDRLEKEIRDSAITVALNHSSALGSALSITFKLALNIDEETILSNIVTTHSGLPLPENKAISLDVPKTSTGLQKVAIYEAEGASATVVTHNFTDPSSWWQCSILVTAEVLTNTVGTTYKSAAINWIDLQNGRIYDEDNIMAANANKYKPLVYVDGVLQETGYTINYRLGEVTFTTPQIGIITATFYKADKSYFILKPATGAVIGIKAAEVQFCNDTVINGAFIFEAWITHSVYGLIPVPNSQIVYKNFKDFISASNEGQGLIPRIGDLAGDVHVFPFNYARPRVIKSSQAAELRVYIKNHVPCGGTYATGTFYISSETE